MLEEEAYGLNQVMTLPPRALYIPTGFDHIWTEGVTATPDICSAMYLAAARGLTDLVVIDSDDYTTEPLTTTQERLGAGLQPGSQADYDAAITLAVIVRGPLIANPPPLNTISLDGIYLGETKRWSTLRLTRNQKQNRPENTR